MATLRYVIAQGPGYEFAVEYNDVNNNAGALYYRNDTGHMIEARALVGGIGWVPATGMREFPPGESRVNFPNNVVHMGFRTVDGEQVFVPLELQQTEIHVTLS